MRTAHRWTTALALTSACTAMAALAAAPAGAAGWPGPSSPGAADLGDRLFPGLGNGGYDVKHYHLDLRYATSAPTQGFDGDVTIVARATQGLSRFNLDFGGQGVSAVRVNRRRARWTRAGEELVVSPRQPLRRGSTFVVEVDDFSATPTVPDPADPSSVAFFVTDVGSATAPQPNYAHRIFPSNDHPRDKASFSFRIDVPSDVKAATNGVPTGRHTRRDRTVWTSYQRQPMATQLLQLAVGKYDHTWRGRQRGVVVRDVTSPTLTSAIGSQLATELEHLDWMEPRVGAYPFDIYGSLVVDAQFGFALETQTLSLYPGFAFTLLPQSVWDPVMLHELAHQWFGDDVALWDWSDLWLSEGHATWYEVLYAEEKGHLEESRGFADFDDFMESVYALGDQWRDQYGPVAQPLVDGPLFSSNVYEGGALVLYALRQEIGEARFERLERAWLERYGGESASTADFIALASRVAGRDLSGFLRAWLYGATTPPMPGHPDWTVLPVEAPAPAVQELRSGELPGARLRRR